MKQLEVRLGYGCNNNCVFCLNKSKRFHKDFPLNVLIEEIKKAIKTGCRNLTITGGEPLIHKDFFNLLDSAIAEGIEEIVIQTNGRMLSYEDLLKKIISRPARFSFLVSFHFPNKDLYNKYCQVDGFDQVVKGIKNLVKNKCSFTTNTAIFKYNISNLKEINKILEKLGVKNSQIRFAEESGISLDQFKESVPTITEAAKAVKEILSCSNLKTFSHEIPLCVLGKKFKSNTSLINADKSSFGEGGLQTVVEIIDQKFLYPLPCKECRQKNNCRGIRKIYYEIYGSSELKPFIK